MTTNVPQPTFGPNGFVPPPESQILAGVQADINAAFGGNLNPALETPQGQLASSEASIIGNVYDLFVNLTNQMDPAFAAGRMQDALGRIYFIERIPSASTVLTVVCSGLEKVIIPVGAQIIDTGQNIYQCTGSGSITNGTVTLEFAALVPGPTAVPSTNGVSIYNALPGWDGVVCLGGVVGNDTESRSQFEARREATVAANAAGTIPAIQGSVINVPGVLDAYVTDNSSGTGPVVVNGTTLVKNSLYVAAVGGLDSDVATAIWRKKQPGCDYNGNTTVVVQDTQGYSPPFPSYNVKFMRPAPLPILFSVSLVNSPQVPSDAVTQIQNALLSAFAGGDGGPRARIGSTLYATRYVAPVQALGAWAQITILTIGSRHTPSAVVTGSCGGTALNITGVTSGSLSVGVTLESSGTGGFVPGTKITQFVSGVGGTGTYTINIPQTIGTGTIFAVSPGFISVGVQINESPTLAAPDIAVVLV